MMAPRVERITGKSPWIALTKPWGAGAPKPRKVPKQCGVIEGFKGKSGWLFDISKDISESRNLLDRVDDRLCNILLKMVNRYNEMAAEAVLDQYIVYGGSEDPFSDPLLQRKLNRAVNKFFKPDYSSGASQGKPSYARVTYDGSFYGSNRPHVIPPGSRGGL